MPSFVALNFFDSNIRPPERAQILQPLTENLPQKITTPYGATFELVLPHTPEAPHHLILNLIRSNSATGITTERDIQEGAALAITIGRILGLEIHNDVESYTISKNGKNTGSDPSIEHWHIYGFRDRTAKIQVYRNNLSTIFASPKEDSGSSAHTES